jgi:hypothetical protein
MTDTPTPETDAFRPCHLTPSDWPWFARGMEIERNAARADVARLREAIVQTIAEGGNELPEWVEAKLEKVLATLSK